MSVYRYPAEPVVPNENKSMVQPGTLATDYLMLHRHKVNYDDGKAGNNFYSRKTPGNHQKVIYDKDVIYIAMPPNIQTSYGPAYKRMDIGVSGVAMTQMLDNGTDMSGLVDKLSGAAKAALPEFSTSAALQLANGFNSFLGLQGNIDLNTIEMLRNGRIFNPFSEQIFAGMSFRTHNFAFKFFIRNKKEASEVYKIIRYIKMGSLPDIRSGKFEENYVNRNKEFDMPKQKGDDIKRDSKHRDIFDKDYFKEFNDGYANDDRYFKVPDRFDLRFCRFKTDQNYEVDEIVAPGKQSGSNVDNNRRDLHFKIYPSVCTGMQVNYTPDNQYLSRKRPSKEAVDVPAVVVSCSFTETRLLTRSDAKKGY
tara:strand:- start:1232 stop:2323 length:1092 start_codon:yes stop_codon:yes gene_type:complete